MVHWFRHQVALFLFIYKFSTRWRHLPLPTYVLLPSSVGIELLSSSVGVKSVKSAKCRETWTHRTDQGYLGPIMTKQCAPWWVDDKVISRCSTTSSTSQDRLGRVARTTREDFGHLEHYFIPNLSLGGRIGSSLRKRFNNNKKENN